MGSVPEILFINKMINLNINYKQFDGAWFYQKQLHKIEIRERVSEGSYRLKGGFSEKEFNLQ